MVHCVLMFGRMIASRRVCAIDWWRVRPSAARQTEDRSLIWVSHQDWHASQEQDRGIVIWTRKRIHRSAHGARCAKQLLLFATAVKYSFDCARRPGQPISPLRVRVRVARRIVGRR